MGYIGAVPAAQALTSADITDGIIINADVKADAAIALSKTALVAGTGITLATNTLNVDAAQGHVTTVGALDAGSITSGFTSIDVGAGAITTTGALSIASMGTNWTNAGRTVANMGIVTTIDINGGTVDGATVGANATSTIKGTTIDATTDFTIGGTVITDNTITDDGTLVIASSTATSFSDGNITNVGNIALDTISADGTDISIAVTDNSATALTVLQGSDAYLIVDTANGSESVSVGTGISGTVITIGHGTSETTFGDNVTITGDLTINGTTTTVASTTLTVADPLVKYGQAYVGSAYDQGFIVTRGNGSASNTQNMGFIWDESADEFATIKAATEDGATAGNVTVTDYVNLHVGAITADDTSVFSGSIELGHASDTTISRSGAGALTVEGTAVLLAGDALTGTTIDATTDFTIGDTVITNGVITDTSGLSVVSATTVTGALTVGVDDTGHDVKFFGASAGAYMEYDQSADQLRIMGASADAATSTGKLLLATSLTDINANDVIGKIDFQAPHEAGGTDAITVAASIQAIAQGTFAADLNATDMIFYTGHSEAATEKFRITSQGELGIGGATYGSSGDVLTSGGAGAAPTWATPTVGDITSVVAGAGMTGGATTGAATVNVIGGDGITANANDVAITAAQTTITSVYNTSLKFGRDSQNLIDFATTDNKIILRVNNVDEVELVADAFQPTTNNGVALGTTALGWSDLHLASAGVINWVNGEMTITETNANLLTVAGGNLAGTFVGDITGDVTGTADVATVATTVTITDNESTDESNALIFTAGGDVDGGNIGLESDGTLTYNPSTGKVTATGFVGALTGAVTGNVTGTADVATVATTVTITDNESTDEANAIIFTAGGDIDGGNLGLESDGTLNYNPSSGTLTTTALAIATVVASGIIKTDDSTDATSTTDGSLQTDGGLSVVLDAVVGNDLHLLSDSAVLAFGGDGEATITHADDAGLTFNSDLYMANATGLTIGAAAQEVVSIGDGATNLVPELQLLGTAAADSSILLAAFSTTATTAGGPVIALAKGGNATLGSHTIVTDGEELGNIIAFGDDGNDLETPAASIQFEVDGTPGANDMPGRIIFNTTADGATALSEALRLDNAQNATFAGNVVLADASNLNISVPLLAGADHTTSGMTAQMLAGGAIAAFDLVCIHTTTQEVVEADASAAATSRVIGIAPAAISDTATGTVLLQGFVRDDTWAWTTGGALYLSETAGAMTHTAPTTDGAFVQVVGVALSPDVVYINPSMDVIEHA
jgi:hypothetical protein